MYTLAFKYIIELRKPGGFVCTLRGNIDQVWRWCFCLGCVRRGLGSVQQIARRCIRLESVKPLLSLHSPLVPSAVEPMYVCVGGFAVWVSRHPAVVVVVVVAVAS